MNNPIDPRDNPVAWTPESLRAHAVVMAKLWYTNRDDVEDAASEMWEKAWRVVEGYPYLGRTLVSHIMANRAKDLARADRRRGRATYGHIVHMQGEDDAMAPEVPCAGGFEGYGADILEAIVASVKPAYAQAVVAKAVGMTASDVAERNGHSLPKTRANLFRARKRVAKALMDAGWVTEDEARGRVVECV